MLAGQKNNNPTERMAKEKWTSEEEESLSAGVEKLTILTDPQFASSLANRSNVDLKDWCNSSGSDHGSAQRREVPTTIFKSGVMVCEDLSVLPIGDPPKYLSPRQLRRLFAASLKKSGLKGDLEKVNICYKFIGASSGAETSQHEGVESSHVNKWYQRFLLRCICCCCSWKFEAGGHKSLEKDE